MAVDRAQLLELADLADEDGVLSAYVKVDPAAPAGVHRPWEIRVRQRLKLLLTEAEAERPCEKAAALRRRLTALEPEFSALLDPAAGGVGRVLFASVSRGRSRTFSFQLPVPDLVVLQP